MTVRVIVTLHLPLEMGAVGAIMTAVAQQYPDAVIDGSSGDGVMAIAADDRPLTLADRRGIAKRRAHAAELSRGEQP